MFRTKLSTTKLGCAMVCALIASSVAAPAASADPPDARGAAFDARRADWHTLRSPGARDAARDAQEREYQDLRSPDAVDAARAAGDPPPVARDAETAGVPRSITVNASDSGGFDWSTAGISVAALSGLLIVSIVALSSARSVRRRVARS